MWSTQIEGILQRTKHFLGCFPIDGLPPFPNKLPATLIINTGSAATSGDHWLAIDLKKDECFYFDSFGLPILEEDLIEFINPYYNFVTYSDLYVQSYKSDKCGFC